MIRLIAKMGTGKSEILGLESQPPTITLVAVKNSELFAVKEFDVEQ